MLRDLLTDVHLPRPATFSGYTPATGSSSHSLVTYHAPAGDSHRAVRTLPDRGPSRYSFRISRQESTEDFAASRPAMRPKVKDFARPCWVNPPAVSPPQ